LLDFEIQGTGTAIEGRTMMDDSTASTDMEREEAEVRQWIAEAGPRPVVPPELLARVRAAAEDDWREVVRQRQQGRRPWAALAAALLLAAVGVAGWNFLAPPTPLATVAAIYGTTSDGPVGQTLAAGDELRSASGERWVLNLAGGATLRLDEGSSLVLESPTRLILGAGAVYVDAAATPQALEVVTPYGSALDIGTQFEVRLGDEAMEVRVREGGVRLSTVDGQQREAWAGEALTASKAGIEASAVPRVGGPWSWLSAAPAPFALEGADVGRFLDWVSQETGLSLVFENEASADRLRAIRTHGTIAGLSPDEALTVVLAGAGLRYRIEGEALVVAGP